MTMTVDQFINTCTGRTVDVDGAYGGQCWDLWSRYAQDVAGVPQSATNTTSGYADSVYTQTWGNQPRLQAAFDKLGPDITPRRGDVAFWSRCAAYPGSHVAIVLADQGANLLCLTQNPGATRQAALTKAGLLGYLRPKTVTAPAQSGPIVVAGTYLVDVDALNVRHRPSTSGAVVATYRRGQTVNLDAWGVYADGYLWGRYTSYGGQVRYIAIGTQGGDWYLALQQ
ncbi:SH3 domain-containing protein [Bifidobacterium samirii]|uniref:N-acetylmuramoyl-L-alanine amidase n=1 Tax=Bifidobacterium samirii TaxID=2306974 RepID=A0A430FEQ4_9BIFI|nr:SH3 domain-containing protein [Bifidobacterium samirii]RSX51333.1 N-acetylmuramyl-L-alanine amidase [Bifidobacterium samirii]